MLKIKHILFPVDFSERCLSAAPFVEFIASRYAAWITLLSVAQPFYYVGMGDPGALVGINTDDLARALELQLGNTLTKEFAGFQVERVAELGDPAQVITEFARANAADLIMMPTHGYGPFRSLLLGSVTAKVLHDSECPVWTLAHIPDPPSHEHVECKKILCAVDDTPASVAVMKWAAELASDTGASLNLVHVVHGPVTFPSREMDQEFEGDLASEASKTIGLLRDSAGLDAPLSVRTGNIAAEIREEAHQQGADLIVIGRGSMHETLGRLRTQAHAIIRESPCPVLSI